MIAKQLTDISTRKQYLEFTEMGLLECLRV